MTSLLVIILNEHYKITHLGNLFASSFIYLITCIMMFKLWNLLVLELYYEINNKEKLCNFASVSIVILLQNTCSMDYKVLLVIQLFVIW